MAKKRITELTEATTVKNDHYIPVDHGADGTQKMKMTTLIDTSLTASGKAADAQATGNAIAAEATARSSADGDLEDEIIVERNRITNLATLTQGSTTGDAELIDIRVGADGTTYANAGSAVREQITGLQEDLSDVKSAIEVNLLESANWYVGSIDPSTGADLSSTNRIRTDFIDITGVQSLSIASLSGYNFITDWYDSNKSMLTALNNNGVWQTNAKTYTSFTNDQGTAKYVRVLLRRTSNADIDTSESTNVSMSGISDVIGNLSTTLGDRISKLENENYTEDGYGLLPISAFQRGLSTSGNIGSALYRIVSKNLVSFNRDVKIKVLNPLYQFYIQFWRGNTYTWESRTVTTDTNVFSGETFRICIQKVNEDTSEYADIDAFRKAVGFSTVWGTNRLNELYGPSLLPTEQENALKIRNTEWSWQIGSLHSSGEYRTTDSQKVSSTFIPLLIGARMSVKTGFPDNTYTYKILFYDASKTLRKTVNWSAYDAKFIVEYPYMRISVATTASSIDSTIAWSYINFFIETGIDDIYRALFGLKNLMFYISERISVLENGLPSYWTDALLAVENTIKGRTGFKYIFITDLHINEGNAGHYGELIDHILRNTDVRKVICGGDLFTGMAGLTAKDALKYLREGISKVSRNSTADYYYVLGNHDRGVIYGGEDELSTNVITMSELSDVSGMNDTKGVFYDSTSDFRYYFDDPNNSIRFIVLNPTMGATTGEGYGESINKNNKFLADSLLSMPDGYNAVVMTHIIWNSTQTTYDYSTMLGWNKNICDIIIAFNSKTSVTCYNISYDFSSAVGEKVVLYHGGHMHLDINYAYNGVNVIATTCDSYALQKPVGSSGRTLGNTTEHAFDVVTVDTDNGKIYFDRIGFGNSREFSI